MSNFEDLATEGYNYWLNKEKYDIDKTVLYNPNPNDPRKSITFEEIKKITKEFPVLFIF